VSNTASDRVRVLVVDPDPLSRVGVIRRLAEQPEIEVVASSLSGRMAIMKIASLRPHVVTIDLRNSHAEVLEMLQHLHRAGSSVHAVLVASDAMPAAVEREAAKLGVRDVVRRSSRGTLDDIAAHLARELVPRILRYRSGAAPTAAHAGKPALHVAAPAASAPAPAAPAPARALGVRQKAPLIVGIGVSTGGPKALGVLLPMLPADFPLPIVLVQHMPPRFTQSLARSLDGQCRLRVREAQDGDRIERGTVLIAPGGRHTRIVRRHLVEQIQLTDDPPECSCRPAVDYLFRSMHQVYGGQAVAVVMTGMGEDGWQGARLLHASGAAVLAQNEATCTVYGMPRGPIEAGIARAVALPDLASAILLAAGSANGAAAT
jgi:two-component system chemotaxis response regulator CheB